jgi:hypothetical protein
MSFKFQVESFKFNFGFETCSRTRISRREIKQCDGRKLDEPAGQVVGVHLFQWHLQGAAHDFARACAKLCSFHFNKP